MSSSKPLPPPPKTPTSTTPVTMTKLPFKPDEPVMGGIKEIDTDKFMAWTGGKPKIDWSGLETKQNAVRPTQFRAQGVADVKSYTHRVSGLKIKLDKDAALENFCTNFWKHMKTCGMDTIAYVPDPADKTVMKSVVENHARFTKEYVKEQVTYLKTQWDNYDLNNDDEAKQFLLNSMKPNFKTSVEQIMVDDDSFAYTWVSAMRRINENTYEYFEGIKIEVKDLSPLSYTGEDIDAWCTALRTKVKILDNSGQYEHKLSKDILNNAMSAGGSGNEDWKTEVRSLRKDFTALLTEIGILASKKDENAAVAKAGKTPFEILDKLETHYKNLLNEKNWPPALNPVDSAAPPTKKFHHNSGYNAVQTPQPKPPSLRPNGFSKYQPNNNSQNNRSSSSFKGKNKKKVRFSNSSKSSKHAWKTVAPKNGEPQTKTQDGKTWHWCAKCNYGKGRWSTTHGTKEHIGKPPTASSHLAHESNDSHHDNLGVWCTAIEDPTNDGSSVEFTSLFVWLLYGMLACYTLYIGINSLSYTGGRGNVWIYLKNIGNAMWYTLLGTSKSTSCVTLALLRILMIMWTFIFVAFGSTPVDNVIEQFLTGGRMLQEVSLTFTNCLTTSILLALSSVLSVILHHSEVLLDLLGDILSTEHIYFWAPFSWMIVAYISVYLTRREFCFHAPRPSVRAMKLPNKVSTNRIRKKKFEKHIFKPKHPQRKPRSKKHWKVHPHGTIKYGNVAGRNKNIDNFTWNCPKPKGITKCRPVAGGNKTQNKPAAKRPHKLPKKISKLNPSAPPYYPPISDEVILDTLKGIRNNQEHSVWTTVIENESDLGFKKYEYEDDTLYILQTVDFNDIFEQIPFAEETELQEESAPKMTWYSFATVPILKSFRKGTDMIKKVLFTAPFKSASVMDSNSRFSVIWDTGASISISPAKSDFIELKQCKNKSTLQGISKGLKVEGEGIVEWQVLDANGRVRNLQVKALYVPTCNVRLLRPNAVTDQFKDEVITITDEGLRLSGSTDDLDRGPVLAKISTDNNLPSSFAFNRYGMENAEVALNATISVVHQSNMNLTNAQKHFMMWHWRLGHPSYSRLMYLFRSGILSNTEATRRLAKSVLSNVTSVPKCAACMFGKQKRLPSPGTTTKVIK